MTVASLNSNQCCGCAACKDICPIDAISMAEDKSGNRRAAVDEQKCLQCGLCTQACPHLDAATHTIAFEKQAYVSYYDNKDIANRSSSGGVFAALALYILRCGGVVYGAAMVFEDNSLLCKHVRIEKETDLYFLQGSKYAQSRTDGIYSQVKKDLHKGKTVLFSGTSCQVASLKHFVGEQEKLFTIDLVCHGVPKDRLFRDYLEFLKQKIGMEITDMTFRTKGKRLWGKEQRFLLTLQCKDAKGHRFTKHIRTTKSAYYNLFLNKAGYRDSCYHCIYATLQKPGDLTLGDFLPRYSEREKYKFSESEYYSTIIVHNKQGKKLLNFVANQLNNVQIPMDEMLSHHHNLRQPSTMSLSGENLYRIYLRGGYNKLQQQIDNKYFVMSTKEILKYFLTVVNGIFKNKYI